MARSTITVKVSRPGNVEYVDLDTGGTVQQALDKLCLNVREGTSIKVNSREATGRDQELKDGDSVRITQDIKGA